MKKHILELLKRIQIEYDVKILYACEAGSRAWGFPSENSDYDIRFIYVHKTDWYLSIDPKRDVIEIPKQERLSVPVHELIDMSGWELTKALRLFRKSNPPLLEWLHSGIEYHKEYSTIDKMNDLETTIFSPVACIHHYIRMVKANFRKIQETEATIKNYINVIRPLLAAKWIEKNNSIAPLELTKLVESTLTPGDVKAIIMELLQRKVASEGFYNKDKIEDLNQYIEDEIKGIEKFLKSMSVKIVNPTEQLNVLFRETLREVWTPV